MKRAISIVCLLAIVLAPITIRASAPASVPVAASFSTSMPANRQSAITLLGSDADGTPLSYTISGSPTHGALSNLDTGAGVVVYTPTANYTGVDSFGYTVTSGGQTSAAGTVTLTVTNAKTRIVGTITGPGGNPRAGKITFILTQLVTTPSGVTPAGSSVSASLNAQGLFDISVYPSRSMSPEAYYQVWLNDPSNLSRNELLGIYDIPVSTATVTLSPYRVTDANLAARYTFPNSASITALINATAAATLRSLLGSTPTNNRLQKYKSATDAFGDSIVSDDGAMATTAGNSTVTGNQSVGGNSTVTGNSTTTGSVAAGAGLTVTGNAGVTGNATVGGSVNATSFTGKGDGLTGIASGTGGVTNTGSTTIGADTDMNDVGKVSIQTGGVERIGIEADGTIKMNGMVYMQCAGIDDSTAITAAVASAAAGWVVITRGQTCAGSDVTIPNLRIERGGLLKPITGHSITLSVNFEAGTYQAFTNALASQGTISFSGNSSMSEVNPEWWGGVPGASSTTQMQAFQQAADSGYLLRLSGTLNGTAYSLNNSSGPLLLHNATTTTSGIEGAGMEVSLIGCTSTAHDCIRIDYPYPGGSPSVQVKNFQLRGAAGATPSYTAGNFGIDVPGYHDGADHVIANLIFQNLKISQFGDSGIRLRGLTGPAGILNCVVNDVGNYGTTITADDNPSPSATQDVFIHGGSIQGTSKGGISIDGAAATVGSITIEEVDIELGASQTKPALYLKNVFGGRFTGLTLASTVGSLSVGDANIYLDGGANGNKFSGIYNNSLGGLNNIHVFSGSQNTFEGGFAVNKSSPPSGLGYKAKVSSGSRNTFRSLFGSTGSFAANHDLVFEVGDENMSILDDGEAKLHSSSVFRQPILVYSYETTWQPNDGSAIANLTSVHTTITLSGVLSRQYVEVLPLVTSGGLVDFFFSAYVDNTNTVKVSLLNATGTSKTFSAPVPILLKVYDLGP